MSLTLISVTFLVIFIVLWFANIEVNLFEDRLGTFDKLNLIFGLGIVVSAAITVISFIVWLIR
jgi:hypothetical protein